jgi:hypothetical protein
MMTNVSQELNGTLYAEGEWFYRAVSREKTPRP